MRVTRAVLVGITASPFLWLATPSCAGPPSGHDAGPEASSPESPTDASDHRRGPDVRDAAVEPDAGDSDAAAPWLTQLAVASPSDAATPLLLVPPFSPTVHDYYVRCAAGENPVTVSVSASPGANGLLVLPVTTPARPSQSVSFSIVDNTTIIAMATNGVATTSYWVQCLPHDMPDWTWTVHAEAGAPPPPGYYLVGNWFPTKGQGGYAFVFDSNGVPVWYSGPFNVQPFLYPGSAAGFGPVNVDTVIPGTVSSLLSFPKPTPGFYFNVEQLQPLGTSTVSCAGYTLTLHEMRWVKSSGHFLGLAIRAATADMTGVSIPLPDGGALPLGPDTTIEDQVVVECAPDGSVPWTWSAIAHFDPAAATVRPVAANNHLLVPADGGPLVDPFHFNSIDVDEQGNLLVSSRNMDSVFYVEKSTGKVLWKMGGTSSSLDRARFVSLAPKDAFHAQHDARLLPGWSSCAGGTGQVSVFDDETGSASTARGVVYDVVVAPGDAGADGGCFDAGPPDGEATSRASVAWQYPGARNSIYGGSFRVLPDGSRVIGWGQNSLGNVFTEVDEAGAPQIDFRFIPNEFSYRAIKVPASAFDASVLRQSPKY